MSTETETVQAFPFHAHLYLDHLADATPSGASALSIWLFLNHRGFLAGRKSSRLCRVTTTVAPSRHGDGWRMGKGEDMRRCPPSSSWTPFL